MRDMSLKPRGQNMSSLIIASSVRLITNKVVMRIDLVTIFRKEELHYDSGEIEKLGSGQRLTLRLNILSSVSPEVFGDCSNSV